MTHSIRIVGLLVAALVLSAGCSTVPFTGRSQLNLIDPATERQLGEQSFAQVKTESRISNDPTANAAVKRVGQRLAAASGLSADWEFIVIDEPQVNAFALPGGKVATYAGMFPMAQDDTGLATVLAHEIGHVLAHHGAERISRSQLTQTGIGLIAVLLGGNNPQDAQMASVLLGAGTTYGLELPFSRDQEYEADRIGLSLMARAGYDPHAAVAFWRRMMARSQSHGPPELLSDHPSDENRLTKLEALMPEAMSNYRPA